MLVIGLIREDKTPADNRVALTPAQCKFILSKFPQIKIIVQPSTNRCFSDAEYAKHGITLSHNLNDCDVLLGIKEVPIQQLIPHKTYLFFSHTKKQQSHNQQLLKSIIQKNITLIDYECLVHDDGQRIIGFGFFAGIVGAHNGMMAYGNRTKLFSLPRVFQCKDYRALIRHYFGLKIPNIKIAVTGSGRVAHGIIEVMNLMGIHEVEPDEYVERNFSYPVFVHLKGADLYTHHTLKNYSRKHFHENPTAYRSRFLAYAGCTDILMNGVYWDENIPQLFNANDIHKNFNIQTIADITDDYMGSVPINLGDATIINPVYGVNKTTLKKTKPYLANGIDIMAVGNLPNELPRDASNYFGEQIIKHIIEELLIENSLVLNNATIVNKGNLTPSFNYLYEYAMH